MTLALLAGVVTRKTARLVAHTAEMRIEKTPENACLHIRGANVNLILVNHLRIPHYSELHTAQLREHWLLVNVTLFHLYLYIASF